MISGRNVILLLCIALARQTLEYCVQLCSAHFEKDVEKMERVQKRATTMILRAGENALQVTVLEFNLFRLSKRILRGDLISVYNSTFLGKKYSVLKVSFI